MSNIKLMLIGTLAIGMFLMPAVISTFSGSHDYIAPENVDCIKCHSGVLVELENSKDDHTHANANWTVKQTLDCVECHTVSGIGNNPDLGHAAQKVDCAFCHDANSFSGNGYSDWGHALDDEYGMGCDSCHGPAPGVDMFLDDVYEIMNDPDGGAAHLGFYNDSVVSDILLGGTESCIGCHTHVDFVMNQTNPTDTMYYNRADGTFATEEP